MASGVVLFDKITARLKNLSYGLCIDHCDLVLVARVCAGVTSQMLSERLAERIVVSNLHKNTKKSFSETIKDMHNHFNERSGLKAPWIAADVYKIIMKVTAIVLSNLNKIIDINYYSVKTAKRSNLCHRPFGIGVQGLADTFILHGMAFDSPEAQQLNKDIFESICCHALKDSCELAVKEGSSEIYDGC